MFFLDFVSTVSLTSILKSCYKDTHESKWNRKAKSKCCFLTSGSSMDLDSVSLALLCCISTSLSLCCCILSSQNLVSLSYLITAFSHGPLGFISTVSPWQSTVNWTIKSLRKRSITICSFLTLFPWYHLTSIIKTSHEKLKTPNQNVIFYLCFFNRYRLCFIGSPLLYLSISQSLFLHCFIGSPLFHLSISHSQFLHFLFPVYCMCNWISIRSCFL